MLSTGILARFCDTLAEEQKIFALARAQMNKITMWLLRTVGGCLILAALAVAREGQIQEQSAKREFQKELQESHDRASLDGKYKTMAALEEDARKAGELIKRLEEGTGVRSSAPIYWVCAAGLFVAGMVLFGFASVISLLAETVNPPPLPKVEQPKAVSEVLPVSLDVSKPAPKPEPDVYRI